MAAMLCRSKSCHPHQKTTSFFRNLSFSVIFACGELYCLAVIFGFRRVVFASRVMGEIISLRNEVKLYHFCASKNIFFVAHRQKRQFSTEDCRFLFVLFSFHSWYFSLLSNCRFWIIEIRIVIRQKAVFLCKAKKDTAKMRWAG